MWSTHGCAIAGSLKQKFSRCIIFFRGYTACERCDVCLKPRYKVLYAYWSIDFGRWLDAESLKRLKLKTSRSSSRGTCSLDKKCSQQADSLSTKLSKIYKAKLEQIYSNKIAFSQQQPQKYCFIRNRVERFCKQLPAKSGKKFFR